MTISIDATASKSAGVPLPDLVTPLDRRSARRLLIFQNPGRVSRHYMEGVTNAARRLGVEHIVCELGPIWRQGQTDPVGPTKEMGDLVRRERIGAVVSYVCNGLAEFACTRYPDGRLASFFETMGVPHLMLWTDHPQWFKEKAALTPEAQPLFRSPNNHHFLKSEAAADEVRQILGWANCHGLAVAEDPEMIQPAVGVDPDYDVVAILGSAPSLDQRIKPFLEHDDPDVGAITSIVADAVRSQLDALWRRDVPNVLQAEMIELGRQWTELRERDVRTAAVRHIPALAANHPDAFGWLKSNFRTYFDAVEILWEFGQWQRTFVLAYLGRHFKVGVFGADWTSVGLGGGEWVDYSGQASAYARGRVAINISQGSDEEGVSHKPFQIAASSVPIVHIDRKGLSELFEVGREIEVFNTPQEARQVIGELLADPARRKAMGQASRARLQRDHTWERRLEKMFCLAGIRLEAFRNSESSESASTTRTAAVGAL